MQAYHSCRFGFQLTFSLTHGPFVFIVMHRMYITDGIIEILKANNDGLSADVIRPNKNIFFSYSTYDSDYVNRGKLILLGGFHYFDIK